MLDGDLVAGLEYELEGLEGLGVVKVEVAEDVKLGAM